MNEYGLVAAWLVSISVALSTHAANLQGLRFDLSIAKELGMSPQAGRVFVVLSRTNNPEPRLQLGRSGLDAPQGFARDVKAFASGESVTIDGQAFGFPVTNLVDLPPADYFIQAVFDWNTDFRSPKSPGNLYSEVKMTKVNPAIGGAITLEFTRQIPPEKPPAETDHVKFVKIQSKLLTQFYGRPIFLRAGILLPRDYERESARRYPLWVRIGGLNARYTSVNGLIANKSPFAKAWLADDAPRFILLQLDGAGPNGDPYQVNSANNGPYGDAITQELIPDVEATFRAIGRPQARVLSGVSTGGWAALGLQIFYPDFFNGTWSACPDPVDFRALELANIYEDDNLYINKYGNERPSERNLPGDVELLARREVGVENLLGSGDSYTRSGEQWGAWNAVFGPRGKDGSPVPLWNPQTGKIDHAVAQEWKKYDLRLVLQNNWRNLGPKLRGKIHIAAGEADKYFLNNAVHLLDQSLSEAGPRFEGAIVYGLGKGHGWSNLSTWEMMEEMKAATEQSRN